MPIKDIDFPTSQFYSDHYAGVRPKPEKPAPKTKRVKMPNGAWKDLVVGPIDDTNTDQVLQNMKDLGITPMFSTGSSESKTAQPEQSQTNTILVGTGAPQQEETAHAAPEKKLKKKKERVPGRIKGQDDFFDIVPEFPFKTPQKDPVIHAETEELRMGKVHTRAQSTDETARIKLVQPDVGHDQTKARREWRQANGLPDRARPWKDLHAEFKALTEADIAILKDLGFRPDLVTNPHSKYVERMLFRLHEYRKSAGAQPPATQP